MYVSNQKRSSSHPHLRGKEESSAGTKEIYLEMDLKKKTKKAKEKKDKTHMTWLSTLLSRLLFFSSCGWPSVSLTWGKAMISARLSEHPERRYFTWYQWGKKRPILDLTRWCWCTSGVMESPQIWLTRTTKLCLLSQSWFLTKGWPSLSARHDQCMYNFSSKLNYYLMSEFD